MSYFMKILPVGTEMFHADKAYRNFSNAPKREILYPYHMDIVK
jgi:hypothetical protein